MTDIVQAARVLQQLNAAGVHLWQEEGSLRYRAAKGALTDALRRDIASCREPLLHLLGADQSHGSAPCRRAETDRRVPLTPAQTAIWVSEHSGIAGDAFHISAALELSGPLNREALRTSFEVLSARHEALRSIIETDNDMPSQLVLDDIAIAWTELDLDARDGDEDTVHSWLQTFSEPSFQLNRGPLWRVGLARLTPRRHVLAVVLHHLIADGGSVAVLLQELSSLYASLASGMPPQLGPQPLGFADVALWHSRRNPDADASLTAYWQAALSGASPVIDLWPDFKPAEQGRITAEIVRNALDAQTMDSLQQLAVQEGTTLFTVLWSLFAVLLHRCGGGDDITMTTALSGRDRDELAGVVGLLTNRLPLRADLSDDPPFRALLRATAKWSREAFAHAELPFEQIVRSAGATLHGQRHTSFAQVLCVLHNVVSAPPTFAQLDVRPLEIATRTAKADLYLSIEIGAAGLGLSIEFTPALFERKRIERLLALYCHLARTVLGRLDEPVSKLPLLDETLRTQVLSLAANPEPPVSADTIAERFFKVAALNPQRTALIAPASWDDLDSAEAWPRFSYAALAEQAKRIAGALRPAGQVIALCLPRSAELVAAMLGIVASGNAYLVLDSDLPAAHVEQVRDQAGVRILITGAAGSPAYASLFDQVLDLNVLLHNDSIADAVEERNGPSDRESLAYVMFTSGSTGQPKGVGVTNGNVVHFVDALPCRSAHVPARFLHFAPCSFDASVMEIWGALLKGETLLIAPPGLAHLAQLATLIDQGGVNFAWLTAGLLHAMIDYEADALLGLDHLIAGGDVLSPEKLQILLSARSGTVLANGYGPTETTVLATYHEVSQTDIVCAPSVRLGRPLGHARLYCVDRHGVPVPQGVPGELWIGGPGVAAGYIGQPALTAERFCPDPFVQDRAARVYRTGDRVRFREDGTLEFLGRLDQQIKIRGFRIEPGAIEACLLQHPDIAQAAVTAPVLPGTGERRLIAYFVPRPGSNPQPQALRAYLAKHLPPHMLPAHFITLAQLPLTRNGKLDRGLLPLPARECAATAHTPAGNDAERALSEIWKSLLGREAIGLDEDFFELGGDSIGAMQLAMRAARAGWQLSAYDALRLQTIREQARAARPLQDAVATKLHTVPAGLTPIQRWFYSLPMPRRSPWNQAVRLVVDPRIDRARVGAALTAIEGCHNALRMRFRQQDGEPHIVLAPSGRIMPDLLDLRGITDAEQPERIEAALAALHSSIDLEDGPVWQALWIEYGPSRHPELVLTAHHLVIDAVSWRILLEDLALLLTQPATGDLTRLVPPPASLADWWDFLSARAQTIAPEADLWCARPASAPLCVPLFDEDNIEGNAEVVSVAIDSAITASVLRTANLAWRTTTTELLLAAVACGYQAACGAHDILIDVEHHGRSAKGAPDLSRTIGWFTTIAPVLLRLPDAPDWRSRVLAVKEEVRRVADAGFGFGLLRYLGPQALQEKLAKLPRPEISFNYLGQIEAVSQQSAPFNLSTEDVGPILDASAPRPYRVEIVAIAEDGALRIDWRFARGAAAREMLLRWSQSTVAALNAIAEAAESDVTGCISPADIVMMPGAIAPSQRDIDRSLAQAGLAARNVTALLCLAPQQQGVLFEALSQPAGTHVEHFLIALSGPLDPERLEGAWRRVINRQVMLRSAFLWHHMAQPLQAILREVEPEWQREEISALSPDARQMRLNRWLTEDAVRGFSLDTAPLMRFILFKIDANEWILGWSFHHILLDGWSVAQVLAAVMEDYQNPHGEAGDHAGTLTAHLDYLAWLANQPADGAEQFWKSAFDGLTPGTPLGISDSSPVLEEGYDDCEMTLDAQLTAQLEALARHERVSMNSVVQLAWASLLARFGNGDVVFGVTFSGRPETLAGSEHAVGLFMNTLPMPLRLPHQGSMRAWLRHVQERAAEIGRFQHFSTARIHNWSGLPASAAMFDSVIVYENYPFAQVEATVAQSAISVHELKAQGARTRFALTLLVMPGAVLRLRLVSSRARIPSGEGPRYLQALRAIFEYMVNADAPDFSAIAFILPQHVLPHARDGAPAPTSSQTHPPQNASERAVAELWNDILGYEVASIDTDFFKAGGHSLLLIEYLKRWRDRFGTTLSIAEFLSGPTIRAMAQRLSSGAQGGTLTLIDLSESAAPPLFFAPGASGNPFAYRPLARALETHLALICYANEELMGRDGLTIDDLGKDFAAQIAAWQPDGAIRLAGHSLGAAIAYSAAAALQAEGRAIQSLCIIDLDAPGLSPQPERDEVAWLSEIAEAAGAYFGRSLRIDPKDLAALSPPARGVFMRDHLVACSLLPAGSDPALIDRLLQRYRATFAALAAWRPAKLDVPLRVVYPKERQVIDTCLGWQAYCKNLDSIEVSGNHITMVVAPHASDLARALQTSRKQPATEKRPQKKRRKL